MASFRVSVVCILLAILVFPSSAFGWLDNGHMAVAYVAYEHLDKPLQARAVTLLKLNPYYKKWLAKIPVGTAVDKQDEMIFMIAATWPDEIKAPHTNYKNDPGAKNGDVPGPDLKIAQQNIGYSDLLYHKYWHFVDTPFSTDGTSLPPVPIPDAQTQIAIFRSTLASNASDDLKSYDLVWLLHLVGDVHQPLHCTTRVSRADPKGDLGGNNVKICTISGECGTNELHAFWDGLPGTDRKVTTAMKYGQSLSSKDSALSNNLDVATWISESFNDAKEDVYIDPIKAGDGPFTITSAYQQASERIAQERIAIAGLRLANVLKEDLK
jgi:hypothetical protein